MSWNPCLDPDCPDADKLDAIETLIVPRTRDLGGLEVGRVLPARGRQMVGPFIFFDQMGPTEFIDGGGIDVLPHPHIGIATVTYLYKGEFQHRDSVGSNQMIYPGEVNWMVAGRGVTHSERTSEATRQGHNELFGIQTWVALPEQAEEAEPSFEHHGKEALPFLTEGGKEVRLILGHAWGEKAPAKTFSEMFYADANLAPGAKVPLPREHEDRGAYVVKGSVLVGGVEFDAGRLMVFRSRDDVTIVAGERGARLMLLGGETLNGPRHIWWNFVASSAERIEAAKDAWASGDFQKGRFRLPPGDTEEFVPLPKGI